jgi:hypothetical protein
MAHVVFCGFPRMMRRMQHVRMSAMRMVCRLLMCAGLMMRGCLFMMLRRMLVMLGCFHMMLMRWVFSHADLPVFALFAVPAALQPGRRAPLGKKVHFQKMFRIRIACALE